MRCYRVLLQCIGQMLCTLITDLVFVLRLQCCECLWETMDEVFDQKQGWCVRCYRVLLQCIGQMLCTLSTDSVAAEAEVL